MRKPARSVNFTKLVQQAQKTKHQVKDSQKKAFETWQRKLGKKVPKLDTQEAKLRKALKEINDAIKAKTEDVKMQGRFVKMIGEAFKELKYYSSVPVKERLPIPPTNLTNLQATSLVILAMITYIVAVKTYMALVAAVTKKDA